MAMRDKVPLQELDHDQPKCPRLVNDDPEIAMTIQQDVHKPKKPQKSHSRSKNSPSLICTPTWDAAGNQYCTISQAVSGTVS